MCDLSELCAKFCRKCEGLSILGLNIRCYIHRNPSGTMQFFPRYFFINMLWDTPWNHAREIPDEDSDAIDLVQFMRHSKQAVTRPIVVARNQRRERNRSRESRPILSFFFCFEWVPWKRSVIVSFPKHTFWLRRLSAGALSRISSSLWAKVQQEHLYVSHRVDFPSSARCPGPLQAIAQNGETWTEVEAAAGATQGMT